jgi:hypothetical protein
MKTVIFWHFDVIEIIFALNNAPRQKDNARTASMGFNGHRYMQGPPVPAARTTLQEHRLVKYFHLPQMDQRSDTHSSAKPRNTAPDQISRGNFGEDKIRAATWILGGQGIIPFIIINCCTFITIIHQP